MDLHDGRERGLRVTNNMDGVVIEGNAFGSTLKVKGNVGGTTVTGNTVDKSLTVSANAAPVLDRPNVVHGASKLQ